MSALQVQREQALAEEQYEAKASFDGNCFRHVESQIDIRDWDLRRSLAGYMEARQAEDRLHQEVADRGKLLQEDRFKGVHEIEHLMRSNEFYVDEFSRTQSQENENTVNDLMDIVREVQFEIIDFFA